MRDWDPPYQITKHHYRAHPAEGMVIAYHHAAWLVTDGPRPSPNGDRIRISVRRLHGPRHERENSRQEVPLTYPPDGTNFTEYRSGRVWLCSCCGHPVPCRMEEAEKESARAAREFEARLNRMGPGLCYGCGEVITTRQERVTFPGEHADFPGRSGPTFHTRKACRGERAAYARRAHMTVEAEPLTMSEEA